MTVFNDAMVLLESWGISDVILPFLLIFTVSFAVLQKAKIFGEDKRYNTIIALVLSLAVIIPHSLNYYPEGMDVVNIINSALPGVALFMIIVVMLLLILGILGAETSWKGGTIGGFIVIIALVAIILIFGGAAGWWTLESLGEWFNDPDVQATILIIAVFWIIIAVVTGPEEKSKGETIIDKLGSWFKK